MCARNRRQFSFDPRRVATFLDFLWLQVEKEEVFEGGSMAQTPERLDDVRVALTAKEKGVVQDNEDGGDISCLLLGFLVDSRSCTPSNSVATFSRTIFFALDGWWPFRSHALHEILHFVVFAFHVALNQLTYHSSHSSILEFWCNSLHYIKDWANSCSFPWLWRHLCSHICRFRMSYAFFVLSH